MICHVRDELMRYLELRFPPTLVWITVAAAMWVIASLPPIWPPSSSVRLTTSVILFCDWYCNKPERNH